ncbi:hypothetical protein D3C75_926400 [compost metagenome]
MGTLRQIAKPGDLYYWGALRRWLLVEAGEIFHHDTKGEGIRGDHIQIDMQPAGLPWQYRQADFARVALIAQQLLVLHAPPLASQ